MNNIIKIKIAINNLLSKIMNAHMKYIINRRKFLGLFGCGCCSLILPSCTTVPITERKQLSLFSETKMNAQAAKVYEEFKSKTKLITKGDDLDNIRKVGKRIERSVSAFLQKSKNKMTLLIILNGIMF